MSRDPQFPDPSQFNPEQKATQEAPQRTKFETAVDAAAYLNWKRTVPTPIRSIVERAHKQLDPEYKTTGLELTDAFLYGFAESIVARHATFHESAPKIVKNLLTPLERIDLGNKDFLNVFERLADPHTSWQLKQNLYERQVQPALEWLVRKDTENVRKRLEEQERRQDIKEEKSSDNKNQKNESEDDEDEFKTPPTSDHVMSSMEAGMENSPEGERARAQFTVSPYRGGRYKQRVFHTYDVATSKWLPHEKTFSEIKPVQFETTSARMISGKITGNARLALPYQENWTFDPTSIHTSAPKESIKLSQDENGIWYLEIREPGVHTYTIQTGQAVREISQDTPANLEMSGELPSDVTKKIKELQASGQPQLKQARELVKYIRTALKYSNSKEAWAAYTAKPSAFFTALWKRKEADCYVSNTLACRALQELGVTVQFVGGFFVKEKNKRGDAVLHGSNGHAWLEVWDWQSAKLITLDATPKGDPTMNEEQQEKELADDGGEGEKESEDELMSEKEAEDQQEELQEKEDERNPRERKAPKDREAEVFAGLADCSSEQAREFFEALQRVRAIKDTDGTPISEKLLNEWRKLIEARIIESRDYRGPVRMSEGDRLDDPVSAVIDIRSGERDPGGFERDVRVEQRETTFGGISLFFSFDLSGSMSEEDAASGRSKAAVQRDTALLFIDSIMQCAYIANQSEQEMSEALPIKIMATLASDTGSIALPLTDKWGPKEQWAIYSALTRTARGGTPTHQTLDLIEAAFIEEKLRISNKNIPDHERPLNYAMVITDGAPNDAQAAERSRKRLVQSGMVTRTYAIGGRSTSPDAAPPLASFSELPPQLARDILEEFKKLRPDRVAP